jgi:predicted RNA-binding Zn-ribbon protein involved in translation (DUF1610 family)
MDEITKERPRHSVLMDVFYYSNHSEVGKQFSHRGREVWTRNDLFCPKCGKQKVWNCDGPGDYYVGTKYICAECESYFYLPDGVNACTDDQDEQRMLVLRAKELQI